MMPVAVSTPKIKTVNGAPKRLVRTLRTGDGTPIVAVETAFWEIDVLLRAIGGDFCSRVMGTLVEHPTRIG